MHKNAKSENASWQTKAFFLCCKFVVWSNFISAFFLLFTLKPLVLTRLKTFSLKARAKSSTKLGFSSKGTQILFAYFV